MKSLCLLVLISLVQVYALDNGLTRTPPMGWLAWERFRCDTDCVHSPDTCISEKLFMDMADRLAKDGWTNFGYDRVNIDDCWASKERDANGKLVADPIRFPSGIKALADFMHERGVKLGIYGDYGTKTCAGYPGSQGYEKIDAQTFAEWGVDMLKFDGCNSNSSMQAVGYPLMSKELNATGRPIAYSCSWPAYQGGLPPKVNYTLLGEICNLWRNYNDIDDDFNSVVKIINWWGDNQKYLIPAAGPGHWNDPDMLLIGDFSLSYDQSKLQFGMWAILAAPLFMSNDLRKISDQAVEILQNKEVLKISQDPLGIQGRRVTKSGMTQLWVRPLIGEQQAIAVMSTSIYGTTYKYSFKMSDLGIENPSSKYQLYDVFGDENPTTYGLEDTITVDINPEGITMRRAVPFYVNERIKNLEKIVVKEEIKVESLEFDLL